MARFQVFLAGETYYIDTELEARVQALEKAVITLLEANDLDTSVLSANLQSSLDFENSLAKESGDESEGVTEEI